MPRSHIDEPLENEVIRDPSAPSRSPMPRLADSTASGLWADLCLHRVVRRVGLARATARQPGSASRISSPTCIAWCGWSSVRYSPEPVADATSTPPPSCRPSITAATPALFPPPQISS
jgi:hypothetical protein